MKRLLLLVVVSAIALSSLPALAKTPKAQTKTPIATDDGDQEPPLVLKVYDVSDIQLAVPGPSRGIDEMDGSKPDLSGGQFSLGLQGSMPAPIEYTPGMSGRGGRIASEDDANIEQLHDAIEGLILGPDSAEQGGRADI